MDRPYNENLLSRLEQTLRQSRAARINLSARLRELDVEADGVRAELAEIDLLISQTEAAICRLLSTVMGTFSSLPSDAELEAAMRQSSNHGGLSQNHGGLSPNQGGQSQAPLRSHMPVERRPQIPLVRNNVEALSDRFMDRTIPQAVTLLLREEGGALHVNEIYNRLLEGGFKFTGQNPTISVAVSLNRNTRFRKVAPGTFDLVMRDASKAS